MFKHKYARYDARADFAGQRHVRPASGIKEMQPFCPFKLPSSPQAAFPTPCGRAASPGAEVDLGLSLYKCTQLKSHLWGPESLQEHQLGVQKGRKSNKKLLGPLPQHKVERGETLNKE